MPRKRARSSSGSDDEEELPPAGWDDDYYDEEGDCVIGAENVLFKTHRVFLTRGSEVLADMFALPQGEQPVEGTTDEHAIFLAGDTAQQFRAFLRYSLAPALANQFDRIPADEIHTVLDLAHFAQKYMMAPWIEYAVAAIQYFCGQSNAAGNRGLSSEVLRSALALAAKAPQASDLWKSIPHLWKLRLETHPRLDYCDALDAAEAVGHRDFLLDLYQTMLSRIRMPPYHWTSTATQFPYPRVKPIHLARILAGYWSLTVMWLHLSRNPPKLACAAEHPRCTANWEKAWLEEIHHRELDAFNPADVISRLWAMEKRIRSTARTNSCADGLILGGLENPFRKVRLEIKDSLAERFFGTEDFALFMPLGAL